jgi:hypothetical protein
MRANQYFQLVRLSTPTTGNTTADWRAAATAGEAIRWAAGDARPDSLSSTAEAPMSESADPSEREQWRRYVGRLDAGRQRLVDEVEADVAGYRGLTMEQRGRIVADLADTAWRILKARPDHERALAWQDPMPADFDAIWKRLVAQYKANPHG